MGDIGYFQSIVEQPEIFEYQDKVDDSKLILDEQFFFPTMKVSYVTICSNPYILSANEKYDEQTYQVINKLWFTLEDAVYENVTNTTNILELNSHGIDHEDEVCIRFVLELDDKISHISISYDQTIKHFVKISFLTTSGINFSRGTITRNT